MPRYVILEHDHPALHWDLMLETGGVLRTWRLAAPPQPGRAVPADFIFDHRLLYLEYEGPVSGDRGTVRRWDRGEYQPGLEEAAPADNTIIFTLTGQRLRGRAALKRTGEAWSFLLEGGPGESSQLA
jgi:hypothetical protein